MRLQNAPLLKPFSKASVFISVFGRFSVNDVKKGAHKWLLIKQLLTDNKKGEVKEIRHRYIYRILNHCWAMV